VIIVRPAQAEYLSLAQACEDRHNEQGAVLFGQDRKEGPDFSGVRKAISLWGPLLCPRIARDSSAGNPERSRD